MTNVTIKKSGNKNTPFTIALKKSHGITLTKQGEDLYGKILKSLKKEIKDSI